MFLSESDLKKYSILNIVRSVMNGTKPGFEGDVSKQIETNTKTAARGWFVPLEVFNRSFNYSGGAGGGYGSYGVETKNVGFIDALRNKALVGQLGAELVDGLIGNVDVPKLTGTSNVYWIGEGEAPTETIPVLGQIALTPKTVSGWIDITRRLAIQSTPKAEDLVKNDLLAGIAQGVDCGCISGTGDNGQPFGILETGDIATHIVSNPDGGAMDYQDVVDMESVITANITDGKLAYLTNSKVRGKLKVAQRFSGTDSPVWTGGNPVGEMNGYLSGCSNNVPSNLTKGSGTGLSAMIFGDWSSLMIGQWGTLDLLVNPYTLSTSGGIRINAFLSVDFGFRHTGAFIKCVDIIA